MGGTPASSATSNDAHEGLGVPQERRLRAVHVLEDPRRAGDALEHAAVTRRQQVADALPVETILTSSRKLQATFSESKLPSSSVFRF